MDDVRSLVSEVMGYSKTPPIIHTASANAAVAGFRLMYLRRRLNNIHADIHNARSNAWKDHFRLVKWVDLNG